MKSNLHYVPPKTKVFYINEKEKRFIQLMRTDSFNEGLNHGLWKDAIYWIKALESYDQC